MTPGLVERVAASRAQTSNETWPYLSRVVVARRLLVVTTPKAACTTVKAVVNQLAGIAEPAITGETHETGLHLCLREFADDEIASFIDHPEWVRAAFVRNPYDRLLSTFKSKVWQPPNDQFSWVVDRVREHRGRALSVDTFTRADFASFIDVLVSSDDPVLRYNAHFDRQVRILQPDLFAYTHLGRFETFARDLRRMLRAVGGTFADRRAGKVVRNARAAIPLSVAYDQRTADLVSDHFRADFDRFGYDRHSWQG